MSLANPDRFYAMLLGRRVGLELYRRKHDIVFSGAVMTDWWNSVGESIEMKVNEPVILSDDFMMILAKIIPFSWHQNIELCSRHLGETYKRDGTYFMLYIMAAVRGTQEMKIVMDETDKGLDSLNPNFKTFINWLRFMYLHVTQQSDGSFGGFMNYLMTNEVISSWEQASIFGAYIGAILGSTRLHTDLYFMGLFQTIQQGENIDYAAIVNAFIAKSPRNVIPRITYPMTEGYDTVMIAEKRQRIIHQLGTMISPNFDSFDENLVNNLLQCYNVEFLAGLLFSTLSERKIGLKISLDDRSVGSVGCIRYGQNERILTINRPIILGTFRRGEQFHCSNGLKWNTRLECLMSTIEHELVHLLLDVWDVIPDSSSKIYSHHGILFQQVAKAYFGHTDFYHAFDIDGVLIKSKSDFGVGQMIRYRDDKGVVAAMEGKIIKLNKRTVKVETSEKNVIKLPYSCILG